MVRTLRFEDLHFSIRDPRISRSIDPDGLSLAAHDHKVHIPEVLHSSDGIGPSFNYGRDRWHALRFCHAILRGDELRYAKRKDYGCVPQDLSHGCSLFECCTM